MNFISIKSIRINLVAAESLACCYLRMKKILVPTDFSSHSDDALSVAVWLAKKSGAEIFLMHLARIMNSVPSTDNADEEKIRSSRNKLFGIADRLEKNGLSIHTIFVEDYGLEEIEKYPEPYGIDFIVMGSHGQSGFKDYIIGSNTRRVVRGAKVPVLVVKSLGGAEIHLKKILFASSFRGDLHQAINTLFDFAKLCQAEVHFLFINLFYHLIREEQAMDLMETYFQPSGNSKITRSIMESNDEETGIRSYLDNDPVDLIVVSMQRSGIPMRWIKPPLAERLIQSSSKHVLILPE